MSWNYRVMRYRSGEETLFAVTEVYYDNTGNIEGWIRPTEYGNACSEELDELRNDYALMIGAFVEPTLTEWELPSYVELEPREAARRPGGAR